MGPHDNKKREGSLIKYSPSLDLNILNYGNEPTFMIQNRKQITNLTLGSTLVKVMYIRSAPSVISQTHMLPNRWQRTTVTI